MKQEQKGAEVFFYVAFALLCFLAGVFATTFENERQNKFAFYSGHLAGATLAVDYKNSKIQDNDVGARMNADWEKFKKEKKR